MNLFVFNAVSGVPFIVKHWALFRSEAKLLKTDSKLVFE